MRRQGLQGVAWLALGLGALLAAAGAAGQDAGAADSSIPDREIGLVEAGVFEVPSPDPPREIGGFPGEDPLLPRAYPQAPPRVPHAIGDFLPITRLDNLCVDCHLIDEKGEGDPTPIPASHRTDLRHSPGTVGDSVAGARWVCVACHLPRTDARPLVPNRF